MYNRWRHRSAAVLQVHSERNSYLSVWLLALWELSAPSQQMPIPLCHLPYAPIPSFSAVIDHSVHLSAFQLSFYFRTAYEGLLRHSCLIHYDCMIQPL